MHLTTDDLERAAYLANDQKALAFIRALEDRAEEDLDDKAETVRKEAYREGYAQAETDLEDADLAADRDAALAHQVEAVTKLKDFITAIKRVEAELEGDTLKTITGRRNMARALRAMRLAHGQY